MDLLQITAFLLDILLVFAAIVAFQTRPRIGGELAKGLSILLIGVVILGFAHFIESVLFAFLDVDLEINEVIHRLLVGFGFLWVIFGFVTMNRAFRE
ncbi:MAG: hypothetical protein HZB51_06210 [Chloroflexi bacterium]|nr:hypothetical protein [Chloroflexota bacterium]